MKSLLILFKKLRLFSSVGNKIFKSNRYNLPYALFLLFQIGSYFLFGVLTARYSLSLWSPKQPLDELIPFLPIAVIFYIMYLPLMAVPLFLKIRKKDLKPLLLSLITASLLNYLLSFILSPLPSPRPHLEGQNGLLISLLQLIYRHDSAGLYFPSLHVLHPLLIAILHPALRSGYGKLFFCAVPLTTLSTVFVKQHFTADVLMSLILAPLIASLWRSKNNPGLKEK